MLITGTLTNSTSIIKWGNTSDETDRSLNSASSETIYGVIRYHITAEVWRPACFSSILEAPAVISDIGSRVGNIGRKNKIFSEKNSATGTDSNTQLRVVKTRCSTVILAGTSTKNDLRWSVKPLRSVELMFLSCQFVQSIGRSISDGTEYNHFWEATNDETSRS